jgi:hypothetical protein
MKKVVPLNQYVCRENSRNDSNDSNDSSNSSDSNYTSDGYKASTYIVNIKNKLDINKDNKIDINDVRLHAYHCFRTMEYFYDVSIDNLPLGAMIGFTLTLIASVIVKVGINESLDVVMKYNKNAYVEGFDEYYMTVFLTLILLHLAVLLHGCSITVLETSREICQISEVGCYCCCKKRNTSKGRLCRIFQGVTQHIVQVVWGTVGTFLMVLYYGVVIASFVISLGMTSLSYIFTKQCGEFKNMIEILKDKSIKYIKLAKKYVVKTDNTAWFVLSQYNKWVDMKQRFLDSSLNTMKNISQPFQIENPAEKTMWQPEPEPEPIIYNFPVKDQEFGDIVYNGNVINRKLFGVDGNTNYTGFDPILEIGNGRSILSVLNTSIHEAEKQVIYYSSQMHNASIMCEDYASIYYSLNSVLVGCIILLISHYIMSAVHYKYFSVWNYEVKLVRLNNFRITEK